MFYKDVDKRNRKAMTEFLQDHFRYNTANSWNRSTSYANNIKIHNLGLSKDIADRLWNMLECEEIYERFRERMEDFGQGHDWRWQAGINGRSGGYLILYQGEAKPSQYRSICPFCGQKNYQSVKETGNDVCGRCGRHGRVDFAVPHLSISVYPGRSTDMDEDFETWTMDELRDRVTLVQEFDKLTDSIISEAVWFAENFRVEEETYSVPATRKVLAAI